MAEPSDRRVAHVVPKAGLLTEQWIAAQVSGSRRYSSSVWSMDPPAHPYHWSIQPAGTLRAGWLGLRGAMKFPHTMKAGVGAAAAVGLRRARADLHHIHFGTLAAAWSLVSDRLERPFVASFYGQDASAHEFSEEPWTTWYAGLFERTSRLLVEGPHLGERLAALGAEPSKIAVIRLPLGLATVPHSEDVRATAGRAAAAPYAAVLAGRLVAKKGFAIGIEAFAKAFPTGSERLLIVGDGPEREHLRATAGDLGVGDRLDVIPGVPFADFVPTLMSACVAMFPSVTAPDGDGEGGAPMVLPLAQALGMSVIVSDHDDLPFAAASNTPVVASGSSAQLAEALAVAVDTVRTGAPDHIEGVVAAATEVAARHDDVRLTAQREAIYDEVLGSA